MSASHITPEFHEVPFSHPRLIAYTFVCTSPPIPGHRTICTDIIREDQRPSRPIRPIHRLRTDVSL